MAMPLAVALVTWQLLKHAPWQRAIRALKAQPGRSILTDGSSQLVHALIASDLVDELHSLVYPLTVGSGKRALPDGVQATSA